MHRCASFTKHDDATGPQAYTGIAALPRKLGRLMPDPQLCLLSLAVPRSSSAAELSPISSPHEQYKAI